MNLFISVYFSSLLGNVGTETWSPTLPELLLFLLVSVPLSSADTHTLQFLYTGVTPGINFPEFTAVALVDGEQAEYYDSNIKEAIPKTEWIKKFDAKFWKSETDVWQTEQEWLKVDVKALMQHFNQSKGVHTVQLMFGCELDDDDTIRGYSRFSYDGEDLVSLDLETETWTKVKSQAMITIKKWKPTGHESDYCAYYLKHECIHSLRTFVSYGREILDRKVPPEVSVFQKHSPYPEVVCHATGFFPKALTITWQKDGEDVIEDVEFTETLPNQDGSFQKRSILKVPAEELQKHKYTCVVQHSSLEEDLILEVPTGGGSGGGSDGGSGGVQIGVIVGVLVALVAVVAVGIVFWKKRNSEFKPVPPKPSSEGDSSSNNS